MCDLRIVLLPILFSLGIFPPSNQLNKMERRRIYGWNLWLAKKIKNKNIYPTNYTTECFHSSYSFRYRPPPCFFGLFSKRCCFLSRIRNLWGNLVVVPTVATSLYLLGPRFSSLKLGQKAVFTRNGVGSLLGLGLACALTTRISLGPAPMLFSS